MRSKSRFYNYRTQGVSGKNEQHAQTPVVVEVKNTVYLEIKLKLDLSGPQSLKIL